MARLRAVHPGLFGVHPIVGVDPRAGAGCDGAVIAGSLREAAEVAPPADAVVHVCTPPGTRVEVLTLLAELGFRRILVEKPLACGLEALAAVERLRARHDLDLVVLTHWLAADLTRRLVELVRSAEFGPLQSITVRQDKPRFTRAASQAHADAFDVEIPHALAVALTLAGTGSVTRAGWIDAPLSGAWLRVDHASGVTTSVHSDLTSPVRRREIILRLRDTTVIGHYPVSADDHHAQLRVGFDRREVLPDDALGAFLLAAYEYFTGRRSRPPGEFAVHTEVVRLLAEARSLAQPAHAG